jgi:hypothetical protein
MVVKVAVAVAVSIGGGDGNGCGGGKGKGSGKGQGQDLSAVTVARAMESWWSGCVLVVARARALAVELWWSGGGFVVARARPLCGSSFAAAALQQCSGGGQLGRDGSSFTSARRWLRQRQWPAWRRHDY